MKTKQNVIEGGRGIGDLSSTERGEICQLYREGEKTIDIQKSYNLKYSNAISVIARKAGVPLRKPKNGLRHSKPAQNLEQQLADVDAQVAALQAKKQELSLRKQSQEIRFELSDDTTVVVHGVTEHFRKLGGCARFLEFVQHHIPQVGGSE